MYEKATQAGLIFISHCHEDSSDADRLSQKFMSNGLRVWRDSTDLWPGEEWPAKIKAAITDKALVFIACFSPASVARQRSYQNEELTLAIEEMRKRPIETPWIFPVRFGDCEIPDRDLGGGRTLRSLHHADLFGPGAKANSDRLIAAVQRRFAHSPATAGRFMTPPAEAYREEMRPAFGVITALPEEFSAMRAMINDGRRLPVTDDRADYVVGTVPSADPDRPHQVVLTLLAETGNDAAASACAKLLRSFTSLRYLLTVGTATGVPRPESPRVHVRLGDIVVATWGVVEHDRMRDQPDGPASRHTSPMLERRARMLQADEMLGNRPWEQLIAAKGQELPEFERPPIETDVLYLNDKSPVPVDHPEYEQSGHRPGWPKVHYGPIGSGDRSLRDAAKRDETAERYDIVAVELGLGNAAYSLGVEWLAIRGISDYGDTRATPRWRNYAAMVASAYARALLAECQPIISGNSPKTEKITTNPFSTENSTSRISIGQIKSETIFVSDTTNIGQLNIGKGGS